MTTVGPRRADATRGVRIKVHPGLCEGWGNCHRFGPAVFSLDADGMVDLHVVDVPADLAEEARLGAAACPQHAITVIEIPAHGAPATG